MKSPAQKSALAKRNGAIGGKASAIARAKPGSSTYGGTTKLLEQAAHMNRKQKAIYGQIFANRVRRNPRGVRPGTIRGPYRKRLTTEARGTA
jgi:hypothetical protein